MVLIYYALRCLKKKQIPFQPVSCKRKTKTRVVIFPRYRPSTHIYLDFSFVSWNFSRFGVKDLIVYFGFNTDSKSICALI